MLKKNEHSFLTEGWALGQKYTKIRVSPSLTFPAPIRDEEKKLT